MSSLQKQLEVWDKQKDHYHDDSRWFHLPWGWFLVGGLAFVGFHHLSQPKPTMSRRATSSQDLPSMTSTVIRFDEATIDLGHITYLNGVFTVDTPGVYLVTSTLEFSRETDAMNTSYTVGSTLFQQGEEQTPVKTIILDVDNTTPLPSALVVIDFHQMLELEAGDSVFVNAENLTNGVKAQTQYVPPVQTSCFNITLLSHKNKMTDICHPH